MNATIAQLLAAVVPTITQPFLQIGTSITQEPYALELIRIAGVNQREKMQQNGAIAQLHTPLSFAN